MGDVAMTAASPPFKTLLLLGVLLNVQIGMTPPHASSAAEMAKYKKDPMPLPSVLFSILIVKFTVLSCILSECFVILALNYGHIIPYANPILYLLAPSGIPSITPTFLAAFTLSTVAALIRLACYRSLGHLFTFEITVKKDHTLVTSGLYSIVRHPAYTGSILQSIAVLSCLFGPGSWMLECGWLGDEGVLSIMGWRRGTIVGMVAFWFLLARWTYVGYMMVRRTDTEDKILQHEFGAQWDLWAARVPYRLIPGVI